MRTIDKEALKNYVWHRWIGFGISGRTIDSSTNTERRNPNDTSSESHKCEVSPNELYESIFQDVHKDYMATGKSRRSLLRHYIRLYENGKYHIKRTSHA